MQNLDLSVDRKGRGKGAALGSLPKSCTIISIDPGGTTGWSLFDIYPEALSDPEVKILDSIKTHQHGQVDCGTSKGDLGTGPYEDLSGAGEAAGINDLLKLFRSWPGAAILVEDFIIRQFNSDRDFLASVRINAVISWWCYTQGRNLAVQQPAEAKTTATDQRMKDWGIWNKYYSAGEVRAWRHAIDADRHGIVMLRKASSQSRVGYELRARLWPHLYLPGRRYGPPVTPANKNVLDRWVAEPMAGRRANRGA